MRFKKLFYIAWLVLGFCQLGDASGSQLLSQEPQEQNGGNLSETNSLAALPVRISRGFFEKQTSVEANFISGAGSTVVISPVIWNENQSVSPFDQKLGNPIAAFDDHVGCAEINNLSPMKLCFQIQGDVSTLTLTPDQMSIEGLNSIANLSCIADSHLIGAKKQGGSSFTVSYRLTPAEDIRCKDAGGVLNLTLQSI